MPIQASTALEANLQIKIYETQVQMEAIPGDVFDYREGIMTNDGDAQIPNDIYLKLSAQADKGRSVSVPFVKALSSEETRGDTPQVGREENIATKGFTMEYNDVSHAVLGQEYGILARDKIPYKLFSKITPLLGTYFKETMGLYRRQALLECRSNNLNDAPVSLTSSALGTGLDGPPALNPNAYFNGLTKANQMKYQTSSLGNNWTEAVGDKLNAMEALTSPSGMATIGDMVTVEEMAAADYFITPIMIGGKERYIYLAPSTQAAWLKHPGNTNGLSPIYRDISALTKEEFFFPGIIGAIGRLLIVEDIRYPTVTLGGSDGSWTVTPKYRLQGRGLSSDPRDSSTAGYDVGWCGGEKMLLEWRPEDFHWEIETENYDKIYGKGMFASLGIKMPYYNVTGGDYTTLQQDSSIALYFKTIGQA